MTLHWERLGSETAVYERSVDGLKIKARIRTRGAIYDVDAFAERILGSEWQCWQWTRASFTQLGEAQLAAERWIAMVERVLCDDARPVGQELGGNRA